MKMVNQNKRNKALNQELLLVEKQENQIKATASAFAVDMILLKFVQSLPVVGILGGAANPVYYRKVMNYVRLKYHKRYLLKQKGGVPFADTSENTAQ